MGMILCIASSHIVGKGDIVGRSGCFKFKLSANSVMRGRVNAIRTFKGLVADLRFNKNITSWDNWYSELKRRDADPTLEKMRTNSNGYYEYFGNTDWFGIVYRDQSFATQHNVSISGGTDAASCLISGGD